MNFKILFKILIFLIFVNVNSQTLIETIFSKIEFDKLNNSDKINLIKNNKIYKLNQKTYLTKSEIPDDEISKFHSEFEIKEFLPKSGFLSFDENFVHADGGYRYDLCYWNTSKNYKLIAVRHFEFATESYDELEFYKLKENKVTELNNIDILPKLEFKDLVDVDSINKDGLNQYEFFKIFKKVIELEYELPKKGKDITFKSYYKDYDLNDSESKTLDKYRKYLKKDLILSWKDGKFELMK